MNKEVPDKSVENRERTRKNCKRLRSPGIGEKNGPEPKRIKENVTPVLKKISNSNDKTPMSAKKLLVGLEKSLHKAKSALTPKRKNYLTENIQPVILWGKNYSNVSTTTSKSPEETLLKLQNTLKEKGIACRKKG